MNSLALRKKQFLVLNRFLISHFIKETLDKYAHLLNIEDDNFDSKAIQFMETVLKRSHSSRLQFKTVCCIVTKFLKCCNENIMGSNYMRHLKYDFLKLVVASFVLSVPNRTNDYGQRLITRDHCYALFSRVTGLSLDEVTNCSSIVRAVLIHNHPEREQDSPNWSHLREEGYVKTTEIEQFDRASKKMVQEYFQLF
ncbi:hypothetical protein ZYGR_0S02540 [Zygosaccharomyces rouxii]|uniref:Cyclin N-terminal domain-containing protein n=1 Tax=Zygosaccharomyces rouxii TaxID=4956 RepID=A0A1Q3A3E9_ZYGRO|nr:hypothetical protein ZYGR_0S02540 [Zygosaccharomyces rouxii]